MHIVFLTNEYIIPPDRLDGGLATYLQKVSYGLVNNGHKVSVLCLSTRNLFWKDREVNIFEVDCRQIKAKSSLSKIFSPASEFEKVILYSRLLEMKVWDIHRASPIDLIQISSYMATGITLCNNGKIPVVCRISSFTPLLRNIYGHPNTIKTAMTDWCQIHSAESADAVYAPSKLMADYYSMFSSAKPAVIRTPPCQINNDLDDSVYLNHLIAKKYLLFFGTLNVNKGILLISKVITRILLDYPDLYFVFIGRVAKNLKGVSLLDCLRDNNKSVQSRIIYLQSLSKDQLYPILKNAVGVLIPSLKENYPNACLEAQAFGKIVIGSKDSSLEEMIIDGETGLLVNNNDANSLEEGIRTLLDLTPSKRLDMEKKISETANLRNKVDEIGNLVLFYKGVLENYHRKAEDISLRQRIDWDDILLIKNRNRKILRMLLPKWLLKPYYRCKNMLSRSCKNTD